MTELTKEMVEIVDAIENTNQNMFITGKAGTGKTTLLHHIMRSSKKNIVVVAPTGVAANNAGGETIHRFLQISPDSQEDNHSIVKMNMGKRSAIRNLDVLVIDEVSMVRCDLMDKISERLRIIRHINLPFGGAQVVMIGDLYQLSPVCKADERKKLLEKYDGVHFFHADVFSKVSFIKKELTKVFRQSDDTFVQMLNRIRSYEATDDDLAALEECRDLSICNDYSSDYIHLCTHRKTADDINSSMLGTPTHSFQVETTGTFPDSAMTCEKILLLRVGARVMTIANNVNDGYYNGSVGTVVDIKETSVFVEMDEGGVVEVGKHTWKNYEYVGKGKNVEQVTKGTCTQIPLILAWAITIHKSQGLTFNKVAIHIGGVFDAGQIYVALSRCVSLKNLAIDRFILPKHIIRNGDIQMFEKYLAKHNNTFQKQYL